MKTFILTAIALVVLTFVAQEHHVQSTANAADTTGSIPALLMVDNSQDTPPEEDPLGLNTFEKAPETVKKWILPIIGLAAAIGLGFLILSRG